MEHHDVSEITNGRHYEWVLLCATHALFCRKIHFLFLETLCESQGAPWRRARHEVWNETVATLTLMALGPRDLGMVMVMGRSICGWYGGSDIRAVE